MLRWRSFAITLIDCWRREYVSPCSNRIRVTLKIKERWIMRRRVVVSLVVVLLGLAGPLRSQSQAADQNPLNQLAWMMGGKWTAEGDNGPDGKPFHVECKLNWTENHRGMKFTTWFLIDGKLVPVYEGMYAWHPVKKKFSFLYTDKEGNLTEGEATMTGDHLEQEFQIVGVD